jgi:hypothetical protein
MWISIGKDIFENSDFEGLSYIFHILSWSPKNSISRYNILIDLESIKELENYAKLKAVIKDIDFLLEKEFDDFINSKPKNSKADFNITNKKDVSNFNIEESIRFFNQPVSIVLENNKNDAYFIKSIIEHLDASSVLKEHLKNGWIKFENAGGCSNVKNFLEGELNSFEDLAYRNHRNKFDYYRGIVILDSDKDYPTQSIQPKYIILHTYLESIGLKDNIHILQKRMMDNYMPDEVFDEIFLELTNSKDDIALKKWINVYKKLDSTQKDFLKYYDGFSQDFENLSIEVQTLYHNQQGANFYILKNGFKYKKYAFKNEFPLKFSTSSRVSKYTLESRAGSDELNVILDKISKLL